MTKWFDTNYHYVVPILDSTVDSFAPLPWRVPGTEADLSWPVLGPYSLVRLSHVEPGTDEVALARSLAGALAACVRGPAARIPGFRLQIDEP